MGWRKMDMRYLILDDCESGCYYYRTKLMYERLGDPFTVIKGDNENINPKDFDAIVYNRIGTGDPEIAIQIAREYRLKIHYDVDDALDLIPLWSPSYKLKRNIHFYYTMLREADLITTSTEYLKNHLSKFTNKPIEIRGNIPEKFPNLKKKNDVLRIGFAGSATHIKDIKVILKALIELQKEIEFEFYLFGFSESYDKFEDWERNMKGKYNKYFDYELDIFNVFWKQIKNKKFIPAVSITAYPIMLSYLNFDIGLCPLEDTEFNRCKSSIKVLEYKEAGAKIITSPVQPYLGIEGIEYAETSEDFCNKIKSMI